VGLRVLLSAYACEPGKGSEPGVGWNWVCQTARFHEVWVFTRANNRKPIEAALLSNPLPTVHFVYVDLPLWVRFWKKGRRGIYVYYYLWQIAAYFTAKKLHQKVRFDVVHHITFVKYAMPSFMALLPVPFVWGPVGGGETTPNGFWWSFSLRGKVFEVLRVVMRRLFELDPFVRLTARRSVLALTTTKDTGARLRLLGCSQVSVFSEAGLPLEEISWLGDLPRHQDTPFRVISSGNLIHWKGTEFGLRAFAQFHREFPNSEYWIVGDGPERKRLERLANRLQVTDAVRLWGELPRSQLLQKLADCDVLMHPSLHDSGGWVCLEAMAAGRPVICLDLGGPALQVTEQTGIKVPANSPAQVIQHLAASLNRLACDPGLYRRMGHASRHRVRDEFNWSKKGAVMTAAYEALCSAGTLDLQQPLDVAGLENLVGKRNGGTAVIGA
jgi:glycosyltransferase involved in cell wall biosynthesis